jgi:hypothetical protein
MKLFPNTHHIIKDSLLPLPNQLTWSLLAYSALLILDLQDSLGILAPLAYLVAFYPWQSSWELQPPR